jgi:dimeric dUTPase (all-alpha-NTP-PPase superfamily)
MSNSLEHLIKQCVELQHKFNQRVNPNYLKEIKPTQWSLAINQEVAEAVDSFPWKWWSNKDKQIDVDNLKIETVDILHFVISLYLVQLDGDIDEVVKILKDIDKVEDELEGPIAVSYLSSLIMSTCYTLFELGTVDSIANLTLTLTVTPLILLKTLMKHAELDTESLFKLYILKNALNELRQKYGYKEGKYQKIWGDREDNRYLFDLLKEDITDFETALSRLEEIYRSFI